MKRIAHYLFFVWTLSLIAACNGPVGDLRGATPVGYLRPVINPLLDETAETAAIADLLETPEEYEGALLEINGTYYQRQVVVCSTRPQLSPAQWALADGQERIPAGGMDDHLQNLPSGRIDITVIGRLLRWQGPVGCGRQAQVTEVWYLDVLQVVSPNPITIAAVGPASAPEGGSDGNPPGIPDPAEQSEPSESEAPSLTTTPIFSATFPAGLPGSAGTPILLPTPSAAAEGQVTPTAPTETGPSPTATTADPDSSPATATSAASPSQATPTTNPNSSPIPTSQGGGTPLTVDQEELPPGSIESSRLGPNEIHRWPYVITTTAVITINIGSEIPLDASIAVRDPSGTIIAQQNNAQDGAPEILAAVPLTTPGIYDILITSENNASGYYAILVVDDSEGSYTFVFNGTLALGQSRSSNLKEQNDHFWQFFGTAGETVTIRIAPTDTADLFLRLFGPTDTLLVDFHDDSDAGEPEELLSFTLPDTGMYSILVGELSFASSSYTITLTGG